MTFLSLNRKREGTCVSSTLVTVCMSGNGACGLGFHCVWEGCLCREVGGIDVVVGGCRVEHVLGRVMPRGPLTLYSQHPHWFFCFKDL